MDSETLERIKRNIENNRFAEAALTVISLNEGLELVAEIKRLQAINVDLLGACKSAASWLDAGPWSEDPTVIRVQLEKLQAAIARAKGEV